MCASRLHHPEIPRGSRARAALAAVALALALGGVTPAAGAAVRGFAGTVTDSTAVFSIRAAAQPRYLGAVPDPVFGTRIERISNDPGEPLGPVPGIWGNDSRHVYAKQQPWNATGTLLTLENRGGGA